MIPFRFHNPVNVVFGRGAAANVGQEAVQYGRKALLVYGQASLKQSGLYDRLVLSLQQAGVAVVPFGNVQANPLLSHARQGIALRQRLGASSRLAPAAEAMLSDLSERIRLVEEDRALDAELHQLVDDIRSARWGLYER